MKVIIPVAGKGTRLRPHTYTTPKPLLLVGGKPMLGHILDKLVELNYKTPIDEIIFITGSMQDQIEAYVTQTYDFSVSFVRQERLLGDGHAVHLAHDHITKDDSVMIIFSDTLYEADLSVVNETDADGIIWTKTVENPERFGVVVKDKNQLVTQIVEKPDTPISNEAIVGIYYLKDAKGYMETLQEIIDNNIKSKNEYRNAGALARMIEQRKRLTTEEVDVWADCGTKEALLETNRWLLKSKSKKTVSVEDSIIIEPVHIQEGVKITHSVIGPYVTIAKGTAIDHSIIENSIINESSTLLNTQLKNSLIGKHVLLDGLPKQCSIGDNTECEVLSEIDKDEE